MYNAKGGSFRFEKLLKHTALTASILYHCKVAVTTGHLTEEEIKKRGKHYNVSMDKDVLNMAGHLDAHKVLYKDGSPDQTISYPDAYRAGWEKLQSMDFGKVKAYMFELEGEDDDELDVLAPTSILDSIGAVANDPDLDAIVDDEEEAAIGAADSRAVAVLEAARRRLNAETQSRSSRVPSRSARAPSRLSESQTMEE